MTGRRAAELLAAVREQSPLVQVITNVVAAPLTANVLLALGAAPAMVDIPVEGGQFAAMADGVLVNLGTPRREQREAAVEVVAAAVEAGTPWVLDPVAVGTLAVRTPLAHRLLGAGPAVIRGNASEIGALAGEGSGGRGPNARHDVERSGPAAARLALGTGAVVAVSGPVDLITDGRRTARVANGTALLTRVSGGGCALGAVMAAFAGVGAEPFEVAVVGTAVYCVAAERAAWAAHGPGTFAAALIDALALIEAEDLIEGVVVR